MNWELVRTVMGYLGTVRGHSILDMFCGIGNHTPPLARAGAQAVGIEVSNEAVARAKANAQENALADKSQFYAVDLYGEAGTGLAIHAPLEALPKAMILDPPRSGAGPNLESWVSNQSLQKVVYVSCNPITFAEDAKVLVAAGYVPYSKWVCTICSPAQRMSRQWVISHVRLHASSFHRTETPIHGFMSNRSVAAGYS